MSALTALPAASLRRPCDFGTLQFETTSDLPDFDGVLGQSRAMEAMSFGLGMRRNGYNLFVLGAAGTGRHTIALRCLKAQAATRPPHLDWAYVFNFAVPHRPVALSFPPSRARDFRRDMERFVDSLRAALPALFESEEYRTRRKMIEEEFQERQAKALKALQEEAKKKNLALVRTPVGFALAPTGNGEVMQPDVFRRMPETVRKQFEADIEEMQVRLQAVVQSAPDWEGERRDQVRALNHEMAKTAVGRLIVPLLETWRELPEVVAHLVAAQRDLIENADDFLPQEPQNPVEAAALAIGRVRRPEDIFKRYVVNVIVSTDPSDGAPVVTEDLPTQANLMGRVEHIQEMGALVADFSLIKAGALHRAVAAVPSCWTRSSCCSSPSPGRR